MAIYLNENNSVKNVSIPYCNSSSSFKRVGKVFVNNDGVWTQVFGKNIELLFEVDMTNWGEISTSSSTWNYSYNKLTSIEILDDGTALSVLPNSIIDNGGGNYYNFNKRYSLVKIDSNGSLNKFISNESPTSPWKYYNNTSNIRFTNTPVFMVRAGSYFVTISEKGQLNSFNSSGNMYSSKYIDDWHENNNNENKFLYSWNEYSPKIQFQPSTTDSTGRLFFIISDSETSVDSNYYTIDVKSIGLYRGSFQNYIYTSDFSYRTYRYWYDENGIVLCEGLNDTGVALFVSRDTSKYSSAIVVFKATSSYSSSNAPKSVSISYIDSSLNVRRLLYATSEHYYISAYDTIYKKNLSDHSTVWELNVPYSQGITNANHIPCSKYKNGFLINNTIYIDSSGYYELVRSKSDYVMSGYPTIYVHRYREDLNVGYIQYYNNNTLKLAKFKIKEV